MSCQIFRRGWLIRVARPVVRSHSKVMHGPCRPPQQVSAYGIGMARSGRRQPVVEQTAHPFPGEPGFLTAPPHRPIPEPTNPEAEQAECAGVRGHPVVAQVPTHNRAQPASHLRDRIVQAPPKLGLHLPQLGLQPLPHRLPEHRKPSVTPLRPADVREPQEVEGLRLPLTSTPAVLGRERPELDQARLVRCSSKANLLNLSVSSARNRSASERFRNPTTMSSSSVHRRRTSLDFPTRPAAPSATGEAGISRLPRKVFPYVLGVCDRAGSRSASRYRRPGCGLPHPPTASAPQSNSFRGSIPGPHVPLSTLHLRSYERRRMTRSRRGSLTLRRMTLPFTTPCRFVPAHRRLE